MPGAFFCSLVAAGPPVLYRFATNWTARDKADGSANSMSREGGSPTQARRVPAIARARRRRRLRQR